MQGQPFRYHITIREHHLDSFGHVNHATYLQIFEEARWQFITENGYGLTEVLKAKLGPVILDVSVRFRKEVRLREDILVETVCGAYRRKLGKVSQKMMNGAGELCCVADYIFGLFDLHERRLVNPTERWLRALGVWNETAREESISL